MSTLWLLSTADCPKIPEFYLSNGVLVHSHDHVIHLFSSLLVPYLLLNETQIPQAGI